MANMRSSDVSHSVTTLIPIIAERWRHAATGVTPQVFKDASPPPHSPLISFISSPAALVCIHHLRLFIGAVSLLITPFFHLLSNDLWDQFDPQTNCLLLPLHQPRTFPDCLPVFHSLLCVCAAVTFHVSFSSSDLSVPPILSSSLLSVHNFTFSAVASLQH